MTNDEIKRLANRAVKLKADWKRADQIKKIKKKQAIIPEKK